MDKNEIKRAIRKAFKESGEMVSKESTTSVRGFHNNTQGWTISEFAGMLFVTYVRNGLNMTTDEDLARATAKLIDAGMNASIYSHNTGRADRIVINY